MNRMMLGSAIAALSLAAATSAFAGSYDNCNYYGQDCGRYSQAPVQQYYNNNGGSWGSGSVPMNCRSSSSSSASGSSSSSSCRPDVLSLVVGSLLQGYGEKRSFDHADAQLAVQSQLANRQLDIQEEGQRFAFIVTVGNENLEAQRIQVEREVAVRQQSPAGAGMTYIWRRCVDPVQKKICFDQQITR